MLIRTIKFFIPRPAPLLSRIKIKYKYVKYVVKKLPYLIKHSIKYHLSNKKNKESHFTIIVYSMCTDEQQNQTLVASQPNHFNIEPEFYDIELRKEHREDDYDLEEIIFLELDELTNSQCTSICKFLSLMTGAAIDYV